MKKYKKQETRQYFYCDVSISVKLNDGVPEYLVPSKQQILVKMSLSVEQTYAQEFQMAFKNFNDMINSDPLLRALRSEDRAWGDIMYDEDLRNNQLNKSETTSQTISQGIDVPSAQLSPPAVEAPQFRRWNAEPQQLRFNHRPSAAPLPSRPAAAGPALRRPAPQQRKRPRNAFDALDDDSE